VPAAGHLRRGALSSGGRRLRPWLWAGVAWSTQVQPASVEVEGAAPAVLGASAVLAVSGRPRFAETFDVATFQKGNLHTHTSLSDGDSPPAEVIAWYRGRGYDFLALTDHNLRSEPSDYAALQDDDFRLIAGEEVTTTGGGRQVHVNALCTRGGVGGGAFATAADALAWAVYAIEAQGGVALVNHPNFDQALTADDLRFAAGAPLLEIKSGHPYVYSDGVDGRPSHEALWGIALGRGARVMGVAVDDMHHLAVAADPPAYPGVGWVEVFAGQNDEAAICAALRAGRLYASTGAELARVRVTDDAYVVWPRTAASVSFVGRSGELRRAEVGANVAALYELSGGEGYVRARVTAAEGDAWTPAVFIAGPGPRPR
jgi:hypothetical protein